MSRLKIMCCAMLCSVILSAPAFAQMNAAAPVRSGTLVMVPGFGSVKQANDQVVVTFSVEEQDKDKAVAASSVNRKMKEGMELIRREDGQAVLRTRNYYTYAVYDERPVAVSVPAKPRQIVGWRVGQSVDVTTVNLSGLPKLAAAAQKTLGLNGVHFSLTEAATRKLDEQRIAVTYQNLSDRIAAIARTMGRNLADSTLESVDFDGAGNAEMPQAVYAMASARMAKSADVEEPSFEPGETTLQMRVVGKVRFK